MGVAWTENWGFCTGSREVLGGENDPVDKVVFILVGRQTLQQ